MNKIIINKDLRQLDVNVRISEHPIKSFNSSLPSYSHIEFNEIGDFGTEIVKSVCAVDGVNDIFIKTYSLTVNVAKAFDKKEVISKVVGILIGKFGNKTEVIWEE